MDFEIALRLQREENEVGRKEEFLMHTSATGKAWKFVEQVMELHKSAGCTVAEPIAVDDMVFTAERLLLTQEEFRAAGKPTFVDLGYHYTYSSNIATIRTDGLMNKAEQDRKNVKASRPYGSLYGSGIYSAANPIAYHGRYGDAGLLVARLRGIEADYPSGGTFFDKGNDSLLVFRDYLNEIMVLPSSRQCIPILQFQASHIVRFDPDNPGNAAVYDYHLRLQHIVDVVFNDGTPTVISSNVRGPAIQDYRPHISTSRPFVPVDPTTNAAVPNAATTSTSLQTPHMVTAGSSQSASLAQSGPPCPLQQNLLSQLIQEQLNQYSLQLPQQGNQQQVHSQQAVPHQWFMQQVAHQQTQVPEPSQQLPLQSYPSQLPTETFHYTAPESLDAALQHCFRKVTQGVHSELASECMVCLDPLMSGTIVALRACSHMFHKRCLVDALSHNLACPCCRTQIHAAPHGRMPTGSMSVTRVTTSCAGYEPVGTICISYHIPQGIQTLYHPHPGHSHGAARRRAYIPDTAEGANLLQRLQYAFLHGLTFDVGYSISNQRDDSVVWAGIAHKTSMSSSSYGFPDANYMDTCHQELDARRVPRANDILPYDSSGTTKTDSSVAALETSQIEPAY